MNTLKMIGKRMQPIFVFLLLEAALAGVLIGCQAQGLDLGGDLRQILRDCFLFFVFLFLCLDRPDKENNPDKWKRVNLIFIAILVFGLLYTLRWQESWNSVESVLYMTGIVCTLILLLIRFFTQRKLTVVTGMALLMLSEAIAAVLLTLL